MKVKPFYIRITNEMTAQDAQDIFDKCIDSGISAGDGIKNATSRHGKCRALFTHKNYGCLGLNGDDYSTYIEASENYFKDAKEITLDQLDEWLGLDKTETPEEKEAFDSMENNLELPNGSEWENGDALEYIDGDGEWSELLGRYICFDDYAGYHVIFASNGNIYHADAEQIRKPETPQQREERERLELVRRACLTVRHDYGLMSDADRNFLEKQGVEWLKAFDKAK